MSRAVVHNDTIYIAGRVADDPIPSVASQTRQILGKINHLLKEASGIVTFAKNSGF
jgi:enamine deaminase RidA (YjgF/YER057c/UK114 family)